MPTKSTNPAYNERETFCKMKQPPQHFAVFVTCPRCSHDHMLDNLSPDIIDTVHENVYGHDALYLDCPNCAAQNQEVLVRRGNTRF